MASLLSWAGKAVKRVANTVNNDVVHPVERAAGAIAAPVVNTAQVPYSATRLAAANVTGNQQAANNARRAVGSDANNSIFTPVKPLGNLVAGSLYARSGALDRNANQAANQAFHVGQIRYGNSPVARAYSGQLAGNAKQQIYGNELNQAHMTPTTSKAGLALRTGGAIASAASPLLYVAGGGAGAASKGIIPTLKVAGKFGAANAAATASGLAAEGAPAKSYVKPVAEAGALGAAAPLVGKAVKVASPVVSKGAKVMTQENPAVTELLAQKQATIKAMDTAKPSIMKNLVANVNSLDSQIKAIKEGGYAKVPGAPADPAAPLTPPSKGIILKETKPRAGRQDVIVARHNPSTGHLEASQESIQAPPKFLQPEGVGAKPALKPNIELDRSIQHTLKNGTSEDAIQTVMDTTGADLQSAAKYVSRVAQQSKIDLGIQDSSKNPKLGTVSVPTVKQGDLAQPVLNAKFVQEHEHRIGQQALDSYGKLTPHDQVLLKQIETGTVSKVAEKANNTAAFKQAEQSIRNYYDTRHAYDRYLGIDVGYRTNYLRQIFNKVEQNGPDSQISLKGSNKRPGYTHERTNDTLGADVHDALQKDINGASFNHAKLAYEQGINEATGGKVAKGELVRTPQDGAYQQIHNTYGQDLSVPKDVAQEINSRTYQPVTSRGLQHYDKVNSAIKYTKLGGGAFHAVTEAGNFVGQQLTSGKLFTNPKATGTGLRTFFSPKTMDREMARFASNKVLDNSALAGLKIMPHEILADANVTLGGKLSKATGIQQLHDATFGREIPYFKLKMFEQKTQGLDPNVPADLAKMRSVAKGVNSLFGGINREVEGLKPGTFQRMQRFVLATDFTESKIGTALRAVNVTDRTPAAKLAREAVVGKVLLFAGLAAAGGALSGEYKGKTPEQIAKNILGKFADPSFHTGDYKVSLPATHVSEFSRPFEPLFDSSKKDRLSGFQHYATGRLAAVPSAALQLKTNKDYSGNRVYGKDYKFKGGEQISPTKTAANVAGMFGPIPFSQASSTIQGKQNAVAGVANIAGLRVTNEKLYSQDATPVKVSFGNNSTTLTKDKAIAFNKATADQKTSLDKQLQSSPAYKTASPDNQKAMLTKLNGYVTENQKRIAATQNNVPLDKQASKAVQAVNQNKLPDNLAKGSTAKGSTVQYSPNLSSQDKTTLTKYASTTDRTKAFNTDNAAEYQYNLAKHNNDRLNGTLTQAQDIKAQDALAKQKVGADYSKNVRDLYGLSKAELSSYLSTPDGKTDKQALASQLKAYDKALVNAGIISKGKFAKGIAPSKGGRKSSGKTGSRKAKTVSLASYLSTVKSTTGNKIKTPSAPNIRVGSSNVPKFKSVSLKQYRLQKSKIA